MKTQFMILFAVAIFFPLTVLSQVGINTDSSTPDPSSMLDVRSTDKGVLLPRMTTAQRDAITSPVVGLIVYNTTINCLEAWTGSRWISLCDRSCGAYVAEGVWKSFHCYNLGSYSTMVDPFTPQWQNHGGYIQWGRKPDCGHCWGVTDNNLYIQSGLASPNIVGAAGPSSGSPGGENAGAVTNWCQPYSDNNSWTDASKTSYDPCPAGYRVPTLTNWGGVVANNTISRTGSWESSSTNFTTAIKFGTQLVLSATGFRDNSFGTLLNRGSYGIYWSSTERHSSTAWALLFYSTFETHLASYPRANGSPVRCIEE